MKGKIAALLVCIVAIVTGLVIVMHPLRVNVIASKDTDFSSFSVLMMKRSEWVEATPDSKGSAIFGRGLWYAPGKRHPQVLVVMDQDNIYWEGAVTPGYMDDVDIPIGAGRPKTASEKEGLVGSNK